MIILHLVLLVFGLAFYLCGALIHFNFLFAGGFVNIIQLCVIAYQALTYPKRTS